MSKANHDLRERLTREREIDISVLGRKSGKASSRPVWFVMEGDFLYLLPVQGSETQWYKNVLHDPRIKISVGDASGDFRATPITDSGVVRNVAEKFKAKYGAGDVKQYYSKFDAAAKVEL